MKVTETLKDSYNTDFIIAHNVSTTWTMNDYHFHDEYEILFSLSDTTSFFVEDTMYKVERNDLFIMNNLELHRTIAPTDAIYDRYVIMFKPKYVADYCTSTTDLLKCFTSRNSDLGNKIHLSLDQAHALLAILRKIEYYRDNSIFGSDVYTKINFIELLLFVNNLYNSDNTSKKLHPSENFKKVEVMLEYINQHLSEDLSLDNLSNTFFLSKYYMSHLFKANTGFSINEYIINRRILKARELLKTNLSVAEVAELVGFKNECHFIRTFKNLVGIPPKQYSKKIN